MDGSENSRPALPPLPSVIDRDNSAALTWVELAHVWTYRNPDHPMTPQQVRRVAIRAARKVWHVMGENGMNA